MRRELPERLLRELLKDSKRSDRELAKVLNVSKPTITRARHQLEKAGMIEEYTIIPSFAQIGSELLAINLVKMHSDALTHETKRRITEYMAKFPNVIFASSGEGLGMTGVTLSLHTNYTDYQKQLTECRVNLRDVCEDIKSFIVALEAGEFKRFSLTHLKDVPF